ELALSAAYRRAPIAGRGSDAHRFVASLSLPSHITSPTKESGQKEFSCEEERFSRLKKSGRALNHRQA
ncbi:MAG: hypothetical protein ACK5XN_10370, partial [Bacteroidota bacterium]